MTAFAVVNQKIAVVSFAAKLEKYQRIFDVGIPENTADHFFRHYTWNIWKLLIFPVEISQSEQQRLKKKSYGPDHQNMKTWSKCKYCQSQDYRN